MNTLKKTILNKYSIEDFIKLKPTIYEYCLNLTQKKTLTSWYRNLDDAKDLYQDVFLYVYDKYFNKDRELMRYGKFVQIMKNCVFYTWTSKYKSKNNKIYTRLNYFDESPAEFYRFDESRIQYDKYFKNIHEHPDYNFYLRGLKFSERVIIDKFLEGYSNKEVCEIFNINSTYIHRMLNKIKKNVSSDVPIYPTLNTKPNYKVKLTKNSTIIDNAEFLKKKISNFEKVFNSDKFIELYSLYLQGVAQKDIAKKLNKSIPHIGQEIYRIKKKIKNNL